MTQTLNQQTREVTALMEGLNVLAVEIGGMAGRQGKRREAAQAALESLTAKSRAISGGTTNSLLPTKIWSRPVIYERF